MTAKGFVNINIIYLSYLFIFKLIITSDVHLIWHLNWLLEMEKLIQKYNTNINILIKNIFNKFNELFIYIIYYLFINI
jgi:hypothetical protein